MKFKSNIIKQLIGIGINEIEQVSREEAIGYLAIIRNAIDDKDNTHFNFTYRTCAKATLRSENNNLTFFAEDIVKPLEHDIELLMMKTYEIPNKE